MSVLDDARRLASAVPWLTVDLGRTSRQECFFCAGEFRGAVGDEGSWLLEHAADCPWRSMPKIVAVLEAAQAVFDEIDNHKGDLMFGPIARLKRALDA